MPRKQAASKALRQSRKRFGHNRDVRKRMKELRKKAEKSLLGNKIDDATKIYTELQKLLDKASKTGGFIKANAAARYKSRLRKKIHALSKKQQL